MVSDQQRLQLTCRPKNRTAVMFQRWRSLLFLHWSVNPRKIQATLPSGLFVDTFEDRAYLGIVPFLMEGVRPRFCPPVTGLSNFPELNLRTYVIDAHGNPGVWFYSLDANQWLAVKIAQKLFSLPYVYSSMNADTTQDLWTRIESTRKGQPKQIFHYKKLEPLKKSSIGSLQFFLAERYLLFAQCRRSRKLLTGRIFHDPYLLHGVELKSYSKDLFHLNGFDIPQSEPEHAMMSPGVDVQIFNIQTVP